MAYVNGNKPIVTNGLIYALDFANQKTYISASTTVNSLTYSNIVSSTQPQPIVDYTIRLTSANNISGSNMLPVINKYSTFTLSWTATNKSTALGVFATQNSNGNLLYIKQSKSSTIVGFYDSGSTNVFFGKGYNYSSIDQHTHYTWVYSNGSSTFYINTVPITSSFTTESVNSYQQADLLHTLNLNGQQGINIAFRDTWSGSLSDVTVYNRILTWDEIKYNYNLLKSTKFNFLPNANQSSLDPDVYSYTNYLNINNTHTVNALNLFVLDLKQQQIWDKLTNIYPFIGTLSSSLYNLKDAGLPVLTLNNSWSFSTSSGIIPTSNSSLVVPRSAPILSHTNEYPFYDSQSSHLTYLTYDPMVDGALVGVENYTDTYIQATGGNVYYSNSRTIHEFTESGDFTVTTEGYVDVLITAGGGSGGTTVAGGGGGGGVIYTASFYITPGTYPVVVGAGGPPNITSGSAGNPGSYAVGNNGGTSSFNGMHAFGGGGGGGGFIIPTSGGNGGGSSDYVATVGAGTLGQGNSGFFKNNSSGGGGGGSGQVGGIAQRWGGVGRESIISGKFEYYGAAGGGSGGPLTPGRGGYNNGGAGGFGGIGTSATGYTGAGGGGGWNWNQYGGAGASGSVYIAYYTNPYTSSFSIRTSGSSILGALSNSQPQSLNTSGSLGFVTVNRNNSNTLTVHVNNTSASFTTDVSASLPGNINLNAINLNGTASNFSPYSIAYASIGAGLTTSEVATYYNLVSQLQTNLKRKNAPVDNIEGNLAAAYGLRRLASGYFAPIVKIRRDSDNALRDIGTTVNGDIDIAAVYDFIGTGSAYLHTWYDQSTRQKNIVITNNGNQPLLFLSGSFILNEYRKPIFDNLSRNNITLPSQTITGENLYTYGVLNTIGNTSRPSLIGTNHNTAPRVLLWINAYGTQTQMDTWDNLSVSINAPGLSTPTNRTYLYSNFLQGPTVGQKFDDIHSNNISLFSTATSTAYTYRDFTNTQFYIFGSGAYNGRIRISEAYAYLTRPDETYLTNDIRNYYQTGSDSDYQAFITATGITEPTQSAAVETLVLDLKSYGLWSKMKAVYPMVTDKYNLYSNTETFTAGWLLTNATVTASNAAGPFTSSLVANRLNESISTPVTFTVTNIGFSAYIINGDTINTNPTMSLEKGRTYNFNITPESLDQLHPFYIMTGSGAHSVGGQYNTGVTGQGTSNGTLTFTVPNDAPSTLAYVCGFHSNMGGTISIIENTDEHYIYQTVALQSGSAYVMSTHARWNGRDYIVLNPDGNSKTWFDIRNGYVSSSQGSVATASITRVSGTSANPSGSWYRCSMVFTSSVSAPSNTSIQLANTDGDLTYGSLTGLSGSFLWGAQIEPGDFISPYLSNNTNNAFTTGSVLDQMKFNLKDPRNLNAAFRLTYSGSITPSYSGLKSDGTTGYANTNFNPSASQANANDISISTYSRTISIDIGSDIGTSDGGSFIDLKISNGSNNLTYDGFDNIQHNLSETNTDTRGYYLVNHNGETVTQVFKNNSVLIENTLPQTLPYPSSSISIFTRLDNDTNPTIYSNRQTGLVSIGNGLSNYEAKALYWIIQKYQTTLGRQVY